MASEIKLYNEDCMIAMAKMPDKCFDLAICDPPYGIGVFTSPMKTDAKGKRVKNNKSYKDDYTWNEQIPQSQYFNELFRISKERVIWVANFYNCFTSQGGALVWYKGMGVESLSRCEIASLSFQKRVSYLH